MPSGNVTYRQRDILLTRCSFIKIRNPNLEIRNKPKHSNPKIEIRNELVWDFVVFGHLDLFRISSFEFAVLLVPWRALRLRVQASEHPPSS